MFKSLLLKGRVLCLLLCCIISSLVVTAQTKHTGKVIGSDDNLPVVGASVRIKGTNTGAVTDVNGEFTLTIAPGNVLEVSYIGYTTKDVTVKDAGFLTISLAPSTNSINEVVVIGYQTQVKKDITGAVATVNVTDAEKVPASSSEQLLQGQASGVTVINQGAPGAPSTVFVRGVTNFGNTTPLYVIDGVQTNNMSQINPSDIESISVLKDAGSAAIYGVSGGNGVIVITTKQGKAGKTVISYDGYYGSQQPLQGNVWHLLNPVQQSVLAFQAGDASAGVLYKGPGQLYTYGYHGNSAYTSPGPGGVAFGTAGETDNPLITGGYFFDPVNPGNDFLVQQFDQSGTDWFHDIFKNAPEQSHSITASGGNDHSTFLYSIQYLDQEGTLIYTYEKRYQARVNNTYSLFNNHLRFGETGYVFYRANNGGSSYNQQQEGGSISWTYREMPIIPAYDIAGNYGGTWDSSTGEPLGNASNPLSVQSQTQYNVYNAWNMQGTVFAEADILKGLTFRTAFSGNANNFFNSYSTANLYEDSENHTSLNNDTEVSGYSFSYNYLNSLTFKRNFGKHSLNVFGAFEIKDNGGQQLGAAANTYVNMDPNFLTVNQTTNPTSINIGSNTYLYQPFHTESYFGRVDYAYNDKYLLGATVRRDGFSAFAPGHQWGTFPSVSLGWRIAQEDFLKSVNWINELKLRGSYGETGSNANIGGTNAVNAYASTFGATDYGITGATNSVTTGYAQTSIGNALTTWEADKILNIGFDASLFNHLDLSIEYYKKSISGLLFNVNLPATTGAATPPAVNSGDVQNTGVDLSATYHAALSKDFKFSITGSLTSYKNKITAISVGEPYFDIFSGSRIGSFIREQVGEPIGEFFGYQTEGIFQNPQQLASLPHQTSDIVGGYIYKDVNGDGKIDANDRTFIGNPNPNFTYGINLNASYQQFDFTMVLYGSQGNKDFNYVKFWTDTYNSFPGGKQTNLLTSSALVNPSTNTVENPGATLETYNALNPPSSFYVEDGSFLKCRVAQIGYNFSPSILKQIGVSKLHLYFQVTNLFTITKYTGLDPELVPSVQNSGTTTTASESTGVDWGAYPNNQKTFMVGANVTF